MDSCWTGMLHQKHLIETNDKKFDDFADNDIGWHKLKTILNLNHETPNRVIYHI